MKIILVIFAIGFMISPAYAYMEDSRVGETQLTAGEQNSNLHRVSNRGIEALKKLKQADDYIERVQATGKQINATALEDLLNSEQKDKAEQEIERLAANIGTQIKNIGSLKVSPDHNTYERISQLRQSQQKDRELAVRLAQQLLRRG